MRKKSVKDPLQEGTSKPLFVVSVVAFFVCVAILLFSQQPYSMQQYAQTTAVSPSPVAVSPSISLPPFGCVAIGNCGTTTGTGSGVATFPSGAPANIPGGIGGLTGLTGTTGGGGLMGMLSGFLQGMGFGNLGALLGIGGGTGTINNGGTQTNVVNNNTNVTNGGNTVNGTTNTSNNSVIMLNGTVVPANGTNTALPGGAATTGTGTTGAGGFFAPVMNFFQGL